MTARPPFDTHDTLSPEERELAARLSKVESAGPSPALDARILAAARAAAAPRAPAPNRARRARRWPTAVGAVATLAVAVGLAWQLKPLLDFPPPLPRQGDSAPMEAEVLARAESIPAPAPPPPSVAVDAPAPTPAPASAGRDRRSGAPGPARAVDAPEAIARAKAAPQPEHDFVDEAIGHPTEATAQAAAAPAAAPPAPVAQMRPRLDSLAESERAGAKQFVGDESRAIVVTGSRIRDVPVSQDAALSPEEWLVRIRVRRDAGDLEGARASLRRFIREYPRMRLPDDLRVLRNAAP